MTPRLLHRHARGAQVAFGTFGARDRAQLSALVDRIAVALPDDARGGGVVIACRDRYFFAAALLATFARGLEVILPPTGQSVSLRELVTAQSVATWIHDREDASGIDVRALERASERSSAAISFGMQPDALRVVLYTSGSTGAPQANVKTLGQLTREAWAHVQGFDLADCKVSAAVPAHHIYGLLFSVLVPLLGGGSMARGTPLFPGELCAEIFHQGAHVMVSVPPQLGALAADRSIALPALRRVFSSAGPLPPEVHAALAARGMGVTEILGSTETGGVAFRSDPKAPWRPLPGVSVEADAEGALWVRSPWLDQGQDGPQRTADRVELVEGGFRHVGRLDTVLKVAGRRVDLGDVEAHLRGVPGVRDARVFAVEGAGLRGLSLWAVVEADDVGIETLRAALMQRFEPVTLPRRFRVVPSLPRTENGKVTRRDLLALFDAFDPTGSGVYPLQGGT